ncbi:MAG: cytochrome c nitrite reductase small subunit [Planctomycetaceae bacterium]|nr:cytochrome c nitrite reductase small subunit [Planctomycetaceae bacterium]
MENAFNNQSPRKRSRKKYLLVVLMPVLTGAFVGTGSYTFMYANGASYLSNDPNACANCHVMNDHLSAWQKSSHHAVATCNDCHAPHGSLAGKYFVKAVNGWNHSLAFTTGNFPDEMRITDFNRSVTEGACRHCHSELTGSMHATVTATEEISCLHCHDQVGHLE